MIILPVKFDYTEVQRSYPWIPKNWFKKMFRVCTFETSRWWRRRFEASYKRRRPTAQQSAYTQTHNTRCLFSKRHTSSPSKRIITAIYQTNSFPIELLAAWDLIVWSADSCWLQWQCSHKTVNIVTNFTNFIISITCLGYSRMNSLVVTNRVMFYNNVIVTNTGSA